MRLPAGGGFARCCSVLFCEIFAGHGKKQMKIPDFFVLVCFSLFHCTAFCHAVKHVAENIHGRGGPGDPTGSLGRRRSRTMSLGGSGSTPQPTPHAAPDEGSGGHYAQRMIQGTAVS